MVYRDCTKGICNRIDKINIESAQECRNACDGLMSIDCQSWDWGEKSRNVSFSRKISSARTRHLVDRSGLNFANLTSKVIEMCNMQN